MTILITGGAGFIGSHLAARLLEETRSRLNAKLDSVPLNGYTTLETDKPSKPRQNRERRLAAIHEMM